MILGGLKLGQVQALLIEEAASPTEPVTGGKLHIEKPNESDPGENRSRVRTAAVNTSDVQSHQATDPETGDDVAEAGNDRQPGAAIEETMGRFGHRRTTGGALDPETS